MLENAKLAKLTISQFGNTRQDIAITEDVETSKQLGKGAGKWIKAKLPPDFLTPAKKYAGLVRQWHYSLTCPWDEGYRLVADKVLAQYRAEFTAHVLRFEEIVSEIDYNAALDKARELHNGTFDPKDYPTAEEFRRAFGATLDILPVPRAAHLTVSNLENLAADQIEEMRQNLENRNEVRLAAAVENVWARLLEPVQAMADKLANPDAVFRDTLVGNIQDICARVDALNITGNSELARAAQEIKTNLASLDVETLRSDKIERKEVAQKAAAILSQFGAMGARRFAESEAA